MKSQVTDSIIDTFQFQDKQQQQLFEILTSIIKLPSKPFTESDLKPDLVIKMQVPKQDYTLKSSQTPYDLIFKNTSPVYQEMYSLVQEYIAYLVQNGNQCKEAANPLIRKMTTLREIETKAKQRKLQLKDSTQRFIDLDCYSEFLSKIDTFTLEYNTIMLILQRVCNFQVKTFLLEEPDPQNSQNSRLQIYFLLSLDTQQLMKTAHKYKIKKQINMVNLDFIINQPVDSAGRPIRVNSFFKGSNTQSLIFHEAIKKLNRDLGLSNKAFSQQIIDQVYLSQKQIKKYENYFIELQQYANQIMFPKKPDISENIHISGKKLSNQHQLFKKFPKKQDCLNKYELQYIYAHNRQKINKGCQEYMIKMKKKKQVYDKIIELNKKYGYAINNYEDTFVQFVLPNKKNTFFEKLAHMLNYQKYKNTPYDEISLFTTMQRIKIAFLRISQVFKVQNFKKKDMAIYAINNQYEKFGDISHQFNEQQLEQEGQKELFKKAVEQKRLKCLQKQWHPFLAFKTNIRAVRDYMGDSFAFQLAFKIHIISYLLIMCIASIGFQIGMQMLYSSGDGASNQKQYIYSLSQLIVLFCSYVFFIQLWKKKQSKYFNNYIQHNIVQETRSTYKGPYVRNLINDSANTFQTQKNYQFSVRENIALLVLAIILLVEGLWFWGIRKLIISNYSLFPTIYLISTAHLCFYCLFFAANYCLYLLVFKKLLQKMVQYVNYAKTQQHNNTHGKLINIYNFGIELIGPLYLMVIEVSNGTSCYAASCLSEFQNYIISRYLITIGFVMLKNILFLYGISKMYLKNKQLKDYEKEYPIQSNMFQFKLNQLLKHIQLQSQKKDVQLTLRDQMIVFFFYSIFFIRFPFGEVFSLLTLTFNYSIKRLQVLYLNKRPIPSNSQLHKYSEIIQRMYLISVLVNCWTIFFNYKFIEYQLKNLITTFLSTINLQNILTFKLLGMVVLFTGFLIASEIFKGIASFFGEETVFEQRKMNKFKQFLLNAKGKPQSKFIVKSLQIIRTIFRTFTLQFVIDYKKNKFNFLKQKLRPAATAELSLRQKKAAKNTQQAQQKSKKTLYPQMANTNTQIINQRTL